MPDPISEIKKGTTLTSWLPAWYRLIRYVIPVLLVFVLIDSVRRAYIAIAGLF
jgi:SNF family Na+-dependent transporter